MANCGQLWLTRYNGAGGSGKNDISCLGKGAHNVHSPTEVKK